MCVFFRQINEIFLKTLALKGNPVKTRQIQNYLLRRWLRNQFLRQLSAISLRWLTVLPAFKYSKIPSNARSAKTCGAEYASKWMNKNVRAVVLRQALGNHIGFYDRLSMKFSLLAKIAMPWSSILNMKSISKIINAVCSLSISQRRKWKEVHPFRMINHLKRDSYQGIKKPGTKYQDQSSNLLMSITK